jgi:flagellar biosynthesis protein FlhA
LGGYTVVDAPSVLITHLGEILRRYSHELLSREDLQKMLDKVKENAPTVVDEIKPDLVRMGVLHQVLVYLLKEGIPIANLTLILESIVHHAAQTKDPGALTELVRCDIGRIICDGFRDGNGRVRVIVLEPRLEMALRESGRDGNLALQPKELENLIGVLSREWQKAGVQNQPAALLTDGPLRRMTRRAIERALPDLAVVAYTEIPGDLLIEPVSMLRLEEVFEACAEVRPENTAVDLGFGAPDAADPQPSAA